MRDLAAQEGKCLSFVWSACKPLLGFVLFFLTLAHGISPPHARADVRPITLFPQYDIQRSRHKELPVRVHSDLLQTYYALEDAPCWIEISHLPLLFRTLQMGPTCSAQLSSKQTLAIGVLPELGYRLTERWENRIRPGILTNLTYNFSLSEEPHLKSAFVHRFQYKVAPIDTLGVNQELSNPEFEPYLLQKWMDVLESYWSFGWVMTRTDPVHQGWLFLYQESLPLVLRKLGSLEKSAAVSYKSVGIQYRLQMGSWVYGLGGHYAALTIDNLRLVFPYPSFVLGRSW